jgi:drug/metabolite transporter (DMT)-like permease
MRWLPMTLDLGYAVSLALVAAILHALWNAMVKNSGERLLMIGFISIGHIVPGTFMAWYFAPPAPDSWVFIAASTIIHWGYYTFLVSAYRDGDLSLVYPIARGASPLLVTLGAWLSIGEFPGPQLLAGIVVVSSGILLLGWLAARNRSGLPALVYALLTGLTIASYSIVDGLGVRASGSAGGYIGWLFLLEGLFAIYVFARERAKLRSVSIRAVATGFGGGVVSQAAYGLVIYAALFAPLGVVSAVRESSVLIAAVIGTLWFREGPWRARIVCAAIVASGVMMIGFARA